VNCKTVSQYLV